VLPRDQDLVAQDDFLLAIGTEIESLSVYYYNKAYFVRFDVPGAPALLNGIGFGIVAQDI
jgi:hypothetical protein